MKFNDTLMKLVRNDIENGLIPMLLGEPGIGKSSWVINLAKLMKTECFVLPCNQLADKADLTGARLVPDGKGSYSQVFYPHDVIHQAIEYAKAHPHEYPILFMDELNRTTPDVTSEALSIPTLRSIGSIKLPDNLRVVTAGNDKGNITSLDEASISRFVLYHVAPDVNTFIAIMGNDINPYVLNVLKAHPDTIFGKTIATGVSSNDDEDDTLVIDEENLDTDPMSQITTPRTIHGISKFLNCFSGPELTAMLSETNTVNGEPVSVLAEAIEGHVGKTEFATYLLQEIANNAMNSTNSTAAVLIVKPKKYDSVKGASQLDQLDDLFSDLTDKERSEILLYLLHENADNAKYIIKLVDHITKFDQKDITVLVNLVAQNKLDKSNTEAFVKTRSQIAQTVEILLGSV